MKTTKTKITKKRVDVDGLGLNVALAGPVDGPPVLLVHGYPDDHTLWRRQIPVLAAAGYRVIAPDMPGCGESAIPARLADYRCPALAERLIALLDALGVKGKVRLIAHDWGAATGWQLALRHPERIDRYLALSLGHPNGYAAAGLAQKLRSWYAVFFMWRGVAEWALRARNWALADLICGFPEEEAHYHALLGRPGRMTAALNYYCANLVDVMRAERQPKCTVPAFGIWSSGDRYLTERQMTATGEHMAAPWRYRRIEGANHWIALSATAELEAPMLDFLR